MNAIETVLPFVTGAAGTILGFAATRWNEQLNERRDVRRAVKHILAETMNARRHYTFSRDENTDIASLPNWRKVIQLGKCRFYGNGLGSFEFSSLRLFRPKIAEQVLDFMLVIRNNDLYLDQAIAHADERASTEFNLIWTDIQKRFDTTLEQSARLENAIRKEYSGFSSSNA